MPSSTSSSDRALPSGPWGRTWLLAAVLAVAVLGSAELVWRSAGFSTSVPDLDEAWALERDRLLPDSVVLVGTSRMQSAIDPEVWAERWDGRWPVQLSIAGGSPLPVLEDLARDPRFRGLAVVDIVPCILFDGAEPRNEARRRIEAHARLSSSPSRLLESRLRIALAERLVSMRMSPVEFADRAFVRQTRGRILYFSMTSRRFLRLDFALADVPRRVAESLRELDARTSTPSEADTAAVVERFARAADAIRKRGGDVLLVHLPHAGEIRERERERRPRDRYWDRLATAVGGVAIHFEDHAALTGFPCPDGSHLDVADSARFTRAFVGAIREQRQHVTALRPPGGA